MPLDVEEFDKKAKTSLDARLGKNQVLIVNMLREDLTKAYTQGEIKRSTGIEFDAAVNTALHSLKIKRLVTNKRVEGYIYWRGTKKLNSIELASP